jgi:glutathione reductase (NADPH)
MMTDYNFDVLYLGAGHGTFDGAIPLAAAGKKVGIIESGLIGGTCPNRGCNAKITLDVPVALQRTVERMQGVVSGDLKINWPALIAQKNAVIEPLPDFIEGLLTGAGAKLIHGHGQLTDAHTVTVDGNPYTADKIVIATGLRPNHLDIPGTEFGHDSTDFMALDQLPARIGIIGSGYISMEFATIAQAAGAEVTVFMHGDKALRRFHQPFVEQLIALMTKRGITFIRNAGVSAFTKSGNTYTVEYGDNDSKTVDWILDATGRIPNIENMGLETVGITTTKHGIPVNDHLQTNVANIYASGDVVDKAQPKLTPTAIFESHYLFELLSGKTDAAIAYPAIPSTVYTSPRLAQVGVSPEDGAAAGHQLVENHLPDDWYRQIDRQTQGENVLVFDAEHHLVGASEISEQAENVINSLLPAVVFGLDQDQMWQLVHIFPSIDAATWGQLK